METQKHFVKDRYLTPVPSVTDYLTPARQYNSLSQAATDSFPVSEPPSKRTCSTAVSKPAVVFTAMSVPSISKSVHACVCWCCCKTFLAPCLCGRWVLYKCPLLLLEVVWLGLYFYALDSVHSLKQ